MILSPFHQTFDLKSNGIVIFKLAFLYGMHLVRTVNWILHFYTIMSKAENYLFVGRKYFLLKDLSGFTTVHSGNGI